MKISYITPIYRDSKHLSKFLSAFATQTKTTFELVLVVDTNAEGVLDVIEAIPAKLKRRVKVIYNSKRSGRNDAIKNGAALASGDYSMITSVADSFDNNFVLNTLKLIKEKDGVDIIEFKAKFKDPIKFAGKIRKTQNKTIVIKDNKKILAYTYPFDFNKIFKTEVLRGVAKLPKVLDVNSKFSIKYAYLPFYVADTYSTSNKTLVISKSTLASNFNPLLINRQWKSLIELDSKYLDDAYYTELMYAKMFHQLVFMFGFVGVSKNKVLLTKLNTMYKKGLKEEFENFFTENKYMLLDNKETALITDNDTPSKLTKVFKRMNG